MEWGVLFLFLDLLQVFRPSFHERTAQQRFFFFSQEECRALGVNKEGGIFLLAGERSRLVARVMEDVR